MFLYEIENHEKQDKKKKGLLQLTKRYIFLSSPEEYYLFKDTKRVGKIKLCIIFIYYLQAHHLNFKLFSI